MEDARTWIHKLKCLGCDLHFAVFSVREDWFEVETAHCPECGGTGPFLFWREPSDQFIFELIPGTAPLTAMAVSDRD